jgi:CHAD domain-containing protein
MTSTQVSILHPQHHEIFPSLGSLALQILEKQFSKIVKQESGVLADLDSEPVHQMRVATRRMRTALILFEPLILLKPKLYRDFAKLAKRLGAVRDLDVLKLRIQHYQAQPDFNLAEQAQLCVVMHRLERLRQKRFKQLTKTLTGSFYGRLVHECQAWFDAPQFNLEAQWQARIALPDLLLPLIHAWLKHPVWLIEEHQQKEKSNPNAVSYSWDENQTDGMLHELRKLTKQVRYQTEFFTAFYGPELSAYVSELKAIQKLLGERQDNAIFTAFLAKILGAKWQAKVPRLLQELQQTQADFQSEWQPFREIYLDANARDERRSLFRFPSPTPRSS